MRIVRYQVTREAHGIRLAAYTVRLAGREFVLSRRLGSPLFRLRGAPRPHARNESGAGAMR